jgi:hypothetical protein
LLRHEEHLPDDELNCHRFYPDDHYIHSHTVIQPGGLDDLF